MITEAIYHTLLLSDLLLILGSFWLGPKLILPFRIALVADRNRIGAHALRAGWPSHGSNSRVHARREGSHRGIGSACNRVYRNALDLSQAFQRTLTLNLPACYAFLTIPRLGT